MTEPLSSRWIAVHAHDDTAVGVGERPEHLLAVLTLEHLATQDEAEDAIREPEQDDDQSRVIY